MLLSWGTLRPQGVSKFASVRFASPVRIRFLRLYPKELPVFLDNPDSIGHTEPDAFVLNIFINAQALPSESETKIRSTNNLITTTLHYTGGMREFALDIGPHHTTRLLILQGDFVAVTMAIYGDLPDEISMDETLTRERIALSVSAEESSLLTILDPINLSDPAALPKELLSLAHKPPSLSLLVRLQFCLKLQDSITGTSDVQFVEWGGILATDIIGLEWFENAAAMLNCPAMEDVDLETLQRFSSKITHSLTEKTNDCLFSFAGLIRRASAQPDIIVSAIFDDVNMSDIFKSHLLDKHIIERLHDAAAHPIVARCLGTPSMIANIESFMRLHKTNPAAQQAAIALQDRIKGWEEFDKGMQGGSPDIPFLVSWVKKLISEDITCGVFLNYLLSDAFWVASKTHFSQINRSYHVSSWPSASVATLSEFLLFLKAFIGISSTLAVFSWAADLNVPDCLERTMSITRLWQEIPSYREVTNYILVLPRVLYRLEDVLRQSPGCPNVCTQYGEQILSSLFDHVETMAYSDLARLVDALPNPDQCSLSDTRRAEMVDMSFIAENGLNEAARAIAQFSSDDSISVLHVALLVIEKGLEDRENGVWTIMQAFWKQNLHGIEYHLSDMINHFVTLIRSQFLLTPPAPFNPTVLAQLVDASHAILRIMTRLVPVQTFSLRLIRSLVPDILNLFILTDVIDTIYPFGNSIRQAARNARPTCAEILSILCAPSPEMLARGETVLRVLLQSALNPDNSDPVLRVEQLFWLLDLVLPLPISDTISDDFPEQYWIKDVIPNVLPELSRFFRALTTDNQVQLVERLVNLDCDKVGLGQWFLSQELEYLLQILQRSSESNYSEGKSVFGLQISKSFSFLKGFLEVYPIGKCPDIYHQEETQKLFEVVGDSRIKTLLPHAHIVDLMLAIVPDMISFTTENRVVIVQALIMQKECTPALFSEVIAVLNTLDGVDDIIRNNISRNIGQWLTNLTISNNALNEKDIVDYFQWLHQPKTLNKTSQIQVYFSEQTFDQLLICFQSTGKSPAQLETFRSLFTFSDVNCSISDSPSPELPAFTFQNLRRSLGYRPTTPPTPHLNGESIFKMATTSPIITLFNSAQSVSLTKTYQQNEFRQLSARQNTSRRPSVHVDDFEREVVISTSSQISADYDQLLPPFKFE